MATSEQSERGWLDSLSVDSVEYVSLVYALVLVWGLGDILSTYFAYDVVGSHAAESNPWMAVLLAYHPLAVIAVKAVVVLYTGIVLLECKSVVKSVPFWRFWLSAVVVAGVFVVLNNLVVGVLILF